MKHILLCLLTMLFIYNKIAAQENAFDQSTVYTDAKGQVYTKVNSPAHLFIAPVDSLIKLTKVPNSDKQSNPMIWDREGTHYIVHRDSERNITNRFKIIADGTPPHTNLDFESGLFFHIDKNFFADKNATINLSARDNLSGVKESFYSIDREPFKKLNQPFALNSEGEFNLRVYSVDNVGNIEQPKEFTLTTSSEAVVRMDNIYFDLNSTLLKKEGMNELSKLAALLKSYPNINLEIRAHTDSRGDSKYNLQLSEQRAQATIAYLTSRGISKTRLRAKGYGDTMLLNECASGVICSEEMHKLNRRVELVVTKNSNE
jgi:outer membrane protein OmpA-like peptidoglycan-associated protein